MEGLELKLESAKAEKKVEELVTSEEKVTDEKIEESLNYDLLSAEEKKAIDDFVEKIDVFDSTQVLQFGASSQAKISECDIPNIVFNFFSFKKFYTSIFIHF